MIKEGLFADLDAFCATNQLGIHECQETETHVDTCVDILERRGWKKRQRFRGQPTNCFKLPYFLTKNEHQI